MMDIQIGKLKKKVFTSKDGWYHVYRLRCHGGVWTGAVYRGNCPPEALESVDYQLFGRWETHPKYGRTFNIREARKMKSTKHAGERKVLLGALKHIGSPEEEE